MQIDNRKAWRPFTDKLNEMGFKRTWLSHAGGCWIAEYCDTIDIVPKGTRGLVVQLWGDGKHRVNHRTMNEHGWHETTPPTYFSTVEAMWIAIQYERVRLSSPGIITGPAMSNSARLNRIREIIIGVDQRAMVCDGPVTPTHQEITDAELARIFALANGKPETWRPH